MIVLPTDPGPRGATPGLLDFGGFLTPGLGGQVQRVNRLGSRFAIAVTMPPMIEETGRVWISRLLRGKSEGARMDFPLLGFDPGNPGMPVVDGAAQAGMTLTVRGFAGGYRYREGQWFSLVTAGRSYLYNVTGSGNASPEGAAALPIFPPLRAMPADGDTLLLGQPIIEGFIHGEEWRWQMSLERHLGVEFEIHEAA